MPARKPLVITADQVEQIPSGDFVDLGKLNIGPAELIDATGTATITVTGSHTQVTSIGTQTVIQINGGETNDLLWIRGQVVTDKITFNTGGNLLLTKKRDVQGPNNILILLRDGSVWHEVSWNG